jgi:hypothetical protein
MIVPRQLFVILLSVEGRGDDFTRIMRVLSLINGDLETVRVIFGSGFVEV